MLLLAAPLVFSTVTLIRERLHFHKMQENLERASLQTLHIPKSDIVWIKPGKELRINGKLFDVKKHVVHEGWLTVTGLFDEVEERIRESLSQDPEAKHPLSEPRVQLLTNLLTPALATPCATEHENHTDCSGILLLSPHRNFILPENHYPIPTPPPRFL